MRSRTLALALIPSSLLLWACSSSTGATAKAAPPAKADEYSAVGVDLKDPLAPTLLMREGQALVSQGQVAEGIERYRAALKIQPTNPTVLNLIGQAELQRGNAATAVEAFSRAISYAPTYTDARSNRGTAYAALKQYSLAEADYLTALADTTYANRTGVLYNLGVLYLQRGNLAAAEENLRRAATASGPVEAYALLGQVDERLERPDQAEAAYRSAIERAPERVDIAILLARLLDSLKRHDEALKLYRRIVEIGPNTPEATEARARLGS
jgi:tetratricopeptide (TPR) repeat protein